LTRVVGPGFGMLEYAYDGLGNRASATHNGAILNLLNDPTGLVSVIAEYDGSGALTARYIQGEGLVGRETGTGARQYYGYDAIGSTAVITDPAGALSNLYTYDPYGRPLSIAESFENRYRWIGKVGVRTEESGLIYMRARYYDPETGRFVSEDPVG